MSRVVVVDYSVGNIHSVVKALRHVGADVDISSDASAIDAAELLVVPGVGAFPDGMRELERRDLVGPLRAYAAAGRPLLGICLGMQLLLAASTEFGHTEGLGLLPGNVVRIPDDRGVKVPHIGWNRLRAARPWSGTPLADHEASPPMVYFVHSFAAEPADPGDRLATVDYGGLEICAAVKRDNVLGMQFHPEKSGEAGLAILRRFVGSPAR